MMRSLALAGALAAAVPAYAQEGACGARHLVTVESDGTVSRGSKDRLRRAVHDGQAIRIGWSLDTDGDGRTDLSPWTGADFLTDFEGEVFAQIDDIQRQAPTRAETRVRMPAGRQRWSGILGTNGVLEGHFDDGTEPRSTRVRVTWCVDSRALACEPQWRLVYRHDADGRPTDGSKGAPSGWRAARCGVAVGMGGRGRRCR